MKLRFKGLKYFIIIIFIVILATSKVQAWSNGGYSSNKDNQNYGTHDFIAQKALDFLPPNEKQYILNNLKVYLYGTELPDTRDYWNHKVYFNFNGSIMDDSSAVRAEEEYKKALVFLRSGDYVNASLYAGIMTHYISDVAVFGHVMGNSTPWREEKHHRDYENYVQKRTNNYTSTEFENYIVFDGELELIKAYNATINLAYDTTFDGDGENHTAVWMDKNYNWSDPEFKAEVGESLNFAINAIADVLHTLYLGSINGNSSSSTSIVINEVELNPPGNDNYLEVKEWVELYNQAKNEIDISYWTLATTHGKTVTVTIPQGTIIGAYGYYVIERGSQWLDNEDESVILRDTSGNEIDRTPILSDYDNDDYSWARYPNGKDTNSSLDWKFQYSTKGYSNGGNQAPIALFTFTPLNPFVNQVITFNASLSYDLDGYIISYSWDFGDNTTGNGKVINHSYSEAGNYTVTLTVKDNNGASGIYVIVIDPFLKGDLNKDGKVDQEDVLKVLNMVIGKEKEDLKADFNNNNRVDIGDAAKIAYYVAGKIEEL